MQPTLLAPTPTAVFSDGSVLVRARYNSETGAPMEECTLGVRTPRTSCAASSVAVDGEEFSGSVLLADIEQLDPEWKLGDVITVIARTLEAGVWSETRYDAPTCGPPTVTLVEGAKRLVKFPHLIQWDYADFPGYWQIRYELTLSGSRLMGDVVLAGYATKHEIELSGPEVAFAADFGGTLGSFKCELAVESTSGTREVVAFDIEVSGAADPPTLSSSVEDGRLLVESSGPFELFAIGPGSAERAAWTDSGFLQFDVPDASSRYYAVTLGDGRIGRADEVGAGISIWRASYLDYIVDGRRKRIDLRYDPAESSSTARDDEYVRFAGTSDPVRAYASSSLSMEVSAAIPEPCDVRALQEELRGIEAVYRSWKGGIWRVAVGSVRWGRVSSGAIAAELSISLNVVAGSPYGLLYGSPAYVDRMLYPGDGVPPGPDLSPGVQGR